MKRIILLAAAALALAACSKEQTLGENNGDPIDFRVSTATRATSYVANDITSIKVFGFKSGSLYLNDTFTRENSSVTDFTSDKKYYWPKEGTLDFYSYYPTLASGEGSVSINATNKELTFTPNSSIASQKDLLVAKVTNCSKTSSVQLPFTHALSQIEVQALENNNTYNFSVNGVTVGNVLPSGTYNFSTSSWASSGTAVSYSSTFDARALTSSAASVMSATDGNAMIIPQTVTAWGKSATGGSYIGLNLQITTDGGAVYYPYSGTGYAMAYIPLAITFEPGKKYTFVLDFSNGAGLDANGDAIFGDEIKFNVTVSDWTDGTTSGTITM